jgi:hypothetical protein
MYSGKIAVPPGGGGIVKTPKENFTKIRNQVTSASGQLECLIVL